MVKSFRIRIVDVIPKQTGDYPLDSARSSVTIGRVAPCDFLVKGNRNSGFRRVSRRHGAIEYDTRLPEPRVFFSDNSSNGTILRNDIHGEVADRTKITKKGDRVRLTSGDKLYLGCATTHYSAGYPIRVLIHDADTGEEVNVSRDELRG